jgi:peroxiredoxin
MPAWEMTEAGMGVLLQDLPEGIAQVKFSSGGEDAVWGTGENLSSVEGKIIIDESSDKCFNQVVGGLFYVAFFNDAKWSSSPVQVRKLKKTNYFKFNDIEPGKYWIAVVAGNPDKPEAIGIERDWPKPFVVKKGMDNRIAEFNLSRSWARLWWERSGIHRKEAAPNTVVPKMVIIGRVIDKEGEPIRNATVQIREHQTIRKGGIKSPDIITDKDGYFFYDKGNWPYKVGVIRYLKRPDEFGYAWQYIHDPTIHQGPDKIEFVFDDMATGTATVRGCITDDNNEPITIPITVMLYEPITPEQYKKEYFTQLGFSGTFCKSDGSFQMQNIPPGDYIIHAYAPSGWKKFRGSKKNQLSIQNDSVNAIKLALPRKNLGYYYGQVLSSKDKKPVEAVSIRTFCAGPLCKWEGEILATPDKNGIFELYWETQLAAKLEAGEIKLSVVGQKYEQVDFNGKILSKKRQEPTPIFVQRRKPTYAPTPIGIGKYSIGDKVDNVTLYDLDGNVHELYEYKGKIVLLNFFATWCRPCVEELPRIKDMWQKNKDKGFVVLSIDVKEMPGIVKQFIAKEKLSWPVYLDQYGKIQEHFMSYSIPTNMLLDKSMKIKFITIGNEQNTLIRLEEELRKLIE